MRVMKICVVLFLAMFVLLGVSVAQEKKAKTVDELAKMYDVSSCKECHPKEHGEWEKSIHARSLIGTGRTMATIRTAIQDGMMKEWAKAGVKEVKDIRVEHMLHCLKCHLPQLKDATDAVAQQIAKAVIDGDTATLEKVSINCIICHNQKALIHKYVDGEPESNAIYGSKEGAHGDRKFTALKKSPIIKESISAASATASARTLTWPIRPSAPPCMGATCTTIRQAPVWSPRPARTG